MALSLYRDVDFLCRWSLQQYPLHKKVKTTAIVISYIILSKHTEGIMKLNLLSFQLDEILCHI